MVKENNITNILVFGLIAALFLLVGQSYFLTGHKNDFEETISVSGNSEMSITPDEAEIYISITTQNDDAKLAQSENKEISAKVIEALKAQGIDEKDIQTTNFRVNENYNYYYINEKEVEVPKYQAVHTLKVKTNKLDSIGTLVDASMNAGANGVDTINYILSDEKEKEVRAQALEKAIIAGKEKAQSMTKTLNVELGEVVSIQENNYYYTPYRFEANVKAVAYDSVEGSGLNYLSPENVEVRSTVALTFQIE